MDAPREALVVEPTGEAERRTERAAGAEPTSEARRRPVGAAMPPPWRAARRGRPALAVLVEGARPANLLLALLAVPIGAVVAGADPATWAARATVPLVALGAALVAAGGNLLNDLTDRHLDRAAHPERPLPSGRASPRAFLATTAASFGLGLAASAARHETLVVASLAVLLLILYEWGLKSTGLPGNLLVAGLVGLLFVQGAIAHGGWSAAAGPALLLGILAALANVARELVKDVQDMASDEGRATFPRQFGRGPALLVASAALVAGVVLSPLPHFTAGFGNAYLAIVAVADGLFLYALVGSARDPARGSRLVKYGMLVALAAFLAGGVGI